MNQGRVIELKTRYITSLLEILRSLSSLAEASEEHSEALRQVENGLQKLLDGPPGPSS